MAAAIFAATDLSPTGGDVSHAATSVAPQDLGTVLPPASSYPPDTVVKTTSVREAAAAGRLAPPASVTVTPKVCADLLTVAVGPLSSFDGWVQLAVRPDKTVDSATAGTTDRGADLDALLATARQCDAAVVRVAGLTGTLSLREFEVADPAGARAVGIQQTVDFGADSQWSTVSAQVYLASGRTTLASCSGVVATAIEVVLGMFQKLGSAS